jgi:GntR family transcriptional regulator
MCRTDMTMPHARTPARQDGPLYRQVEQSLRNEIAGGTFAVGAELPTEAQLAARFGVSLITVRHALRDLEAIGLIRKRPAKTALVIASTPRRASWAMNSFADIVAHTSDAKLEIESWRTEVSAYVAQVFELTDATPCPCLRGRLVVGGLPEADVAIWFPPRIGARLARSDFDDVVVFRSVQRRLGLSYAGARVTVRAEVAGRQLARKLDYRVGGPVLANEIVFLSPDDEALELTIARHRADLYSMSYNLRQDAD